MQVATEANLVRLIVDDTGEGIGDDVRARVTEPFYTTKTGGVGLGLSIVHAIVEAHGGELTFAPSSRGGARVVVALPREARPGPS